MKLSVRLEHRLLDLRDLRPLPACLELVRSLIESVYKHDILNYNYSSDDEIEDDNRNKAEQLTSENDIWSPLSHADLVVPPGIFSNEKAKKELEYKNRDMKDTIKDTIEWLKEKKYI